MIPEVGREYVAVENPETILALVDGMQTNNQEFFAVSVHTAKCVKTLHVRPTHQWRTGRVAFVSGTEGSVQIPVVLTLDLERGKVTLIRPLRFL